MASEGSGTNGTHALTDLEVARTYCERHPDVMRESKALKQVRIYLTRGLKLETMQAAVAASEGSVPIWELFDAAKKNGHAVSPAAATKAAEETRAAEEKTELNKKLLEEKRSRRALVEQKILEMPPAELEVWRREAEEEARLKNISVGLPIYISQTILVRAAQHFGVAQSILEL
jgi:hypothetical protein